MPGKKVDWRSVRDGSCIWGHIDDRVALYPWAGAGPDMSFLNEQLRLAVLYGDPVLVLDSHLLMSTGPLNALINEDASVLSELIAAGFVTVMSRNQGDIAGMPETFAPNVSTYATLVKSADWPRQREKLVALQRSDRFVWADFPKVNFSSGFVRLAETLTSLPAPQAHISTLPTDAFHGFLGAFHKRLDGRTGPRTLWEEEALRFSPAAARELMQLANEMYHVNFAACISGQYEKQVRVSTRASSIFDAFMNELELLPTDVALSKDERQFRKTALKEVPIPALQVKGWRPSGPDLASLYVTLKTPKDEYRDRLKAYMGLLADPRWRDATWDRTRKTKLAALVQSAGEYERKFAEALKPGLKSTSRSGSATLAAAGIALTLAPLAVDAVAPGVGTALKVYLLVSGALTRVPSALEMWKMKQIKLFKRGVAVTPTVSSRNVNVDAAVRHLAGLPEYRP